MQRKILIIDDEADIRTAVKGILEDEGYQVAQAGTAEQGFEQLLVSLPDLVILDVWLKTGERDGLDLLAKIRKRWSHLPILMMSGHGNIEMAVTAIKQGAYDFIEKPFQADRMLLTLERALEAASLRQENQVLREQVEGTTDLLGGSQLIQAVKAQLEKVAPTNSRVLLTGLPGTGKEVAARMIHRLSTRATGPFVVVNCATLEPERLEHELFGSAHHPGTLRQVDGGTLFLDEICDMPLATQNKILRLLQDQKYQHPMTGAWNTIDVRVLSSSSKSMPDMVKAGIFREDLYYRLNVVTLHIPSIADRRDDVPLFIQHFMSLCAQTSGKPMRMLTQSAMTVLQLYEWPGNVRQLKNVAEWLVIMAPGAIDQTIDVDDLPPEINHINPQAGGAMISPEIMGLPLREAREMFERSYLQAQISRFGGSVSKAAQFVGMERSALHRKLKSLNVGGSAENDESKDGDDERAVA
jgi:two-component system, NtrC family, nitrogen regulation response regulator NtrX